MDEGGFDRGEAHGIPGSAVFRGPCEPGYCLGLHQGYRGQRAASVALFGINELPVMSAALRRSCYKREGSQEAAALAVWLIAV